MDFLFWTDDHLCFQRRHMLFTLILTYSSGYSYMFLLKFVFDLIGVKRNSRDFSTPTNHIIPHIKIVCFIFWNQKIMQIMIETYSHNQIIIITCWINNIFNESWSILRSNSNYPNLITNLFHLKRLLPWRNNHVKNFPFDKSWNPSCSFICSICMDFCLNF